MSRFSLFLTEEFLDLESLKWNLTFVTGMIQLFSFI